MIKDFIRAIGQVFASIGATVHEIVHGEVDDFEERPELMRSREENLSEREESVRDVEAS